MFKESIKVFLNNINRIKFGSFEASQQQSTQEELKDETSVDTKQITQQIELLTEEKENKDEKIKKLEEMIRKLFTQYEMTEFDYLSLYLVLNSKRALLWFNRQSSTKDNFISNFQPLLGYISKEEKKAIFSALLINKLIHESSHIFSVSEKGERFLKYIKFI